MAKKTQLAAAAILVAAAVLLGGCMNPAAEGGRNSWSAARVNMLLSRAAEQYAGNDLEAASVSLRQALEIEPASFPTRVLLAKVLVARRSYGEAREEIDGLLTERPEVAEVHYLAGALEDGLGHGPAALACYERASELAPTDSGYLMARVDSLTDQGRRAEALNLVETELLTMVENAEVCRLAGDLATSLEQREKAAGHYRRALGYAPDDADLQHSLAGCYYGLGRYAEAAAILERLIARKPYHKSAWTTSMLGDCRMAMNDPEGASAAYSRAADLDDDNVPVLVSLAKASLACNDYPRAVLSARRALRRDGDNLSATMVLAYSLMRQGRSDQAIDELIRVESVHRDDATLLCLLGKAYEASGQVQLARRYYAQALEVDAGNRLASGLLDNLGR